MLNNGFKVKYEFDVTDICIIYFVLSFREIMIKSGVCIHVDA